MTKLFLEGFDAEAIRAEDTATGSRRLKREWIEKGYVNQLSFYGALRRKSGGDAWGVRIEVHSRTPYTADDISGLYKLLTMATPSVAYSIWTFDSEPWRLRLAGKYERTWKGRKP
jgi:hypothetical protein